MSRKVTLDRAVFISALTGIRNAKTCAESVHKISANLLVYAEAAEKEISEAFYEFEREENKKDAAKRQKKLERASR